VLAARLRPVPSTSNCERMFPVSAKAVVACFAAVKIEMKKLLLVSVLMLAFGSAHAFRNEYSNKPLLGEMNQEDYVCGSIQFLWARNPPVAYVSLVDVDGHALMPTGSSGRPAFPLANLSDW